MIEKERISNLERVDVFTMRVFSFLCRWGWLTIIFLMGILSFFSTLMTIFDHGTWLVDISFIEFIFFVVLAFLLKRYWYYMKKNSHQNIATLAKPIILMGYLMMFEFSLWLMFIIFQYGADEPLDEVVSYIMEPEYLSDLIEMVICLFCFYITAPISSDIPVLDDIELDNENIDCIEGENENAQTI